MKYLMESAHESERLLIKSDEASTNQQLLLTGLKSGMRAADAGGGAGFVTQLMARIVGPGGAVTLIDQSPERLSVARDHCRKHQNVSFFQSDLESIALQPETFDYVFCRFVFEYLKDTEAVFHELYRILKPGGLLVVGDLDHNLLSHHPMSAQLQHQLQTAISQLESLRLWDPFAGRKLYSQFYRNHLKNIRVHVIAHHLFYGTVEDRDVKNWEMKIDQMEKLSQQGILSLDYDIREFRENFMKFFLSPERFSYTPLILVEGVKSKSV